MIDLRAARPADAEAIVALRDALAGWQASSGIDQWQPGELPVTTARDQVARGQWWVHEVDGRVAALVRIVWADPAFWDDLVGPDDDSAGYLHGLMVARAHAGRGLGRQVVRWAEPGLRRPRAFGTSPRGAGSPAPSTTSAGRPHRAATRYRRRVRRAVVLGGSGLIGRAVARRLLASGWAVDLTGRDPVHVPADLLLHAAARFHVVDRADDAALAALLRPGADLLIDCVCFTAAQARSLLPVLGDVASAVMLSSKAVYVDAAGRHVNSDVPPHFDGPIREDAPTMAPRDVPYASREGYGANKVAAERVLLDGGHPVTVIRASKVHGEGASPAREWYFVRRVLDGRRTVVLADRGAGIDHTTAAANVAALVETVADRPGRRILNAADPDAPDVRTIARTIAAHLDHAWDEVLLDGTPDDGVGRTPWSAAHPIERRRADFRAVAGARDEGAAVRGAERSEERNQKIVLDMSAAAALGYRPAGTHAETVGEALDWLVRTADEHRTLDHPFFRGMFDYAAEDGYVTRR